MTLYTFGYAGLNGADDLRALFSPHRIDLVVDVRLRPWSRSPFNGPARTSALIRALGIAYRWERGLGNLRYRDGGLEIADVERIEVVVEALRHGLNVALMCACADVEVCHRRVLADEALARAPVLAVEHLRRPRIRVQPPS